MGTSSKKCLRVKSVSVRRNELVRDFREFLRRKIEAYDRMVDATEWQVDQVAYNEVAHALRSVREKLDEMVRNGC